MSRKNLYKFLTNTLNQITEGSHILNIGSGGEIGKIISDVGKKRHFTVLNMDISSERKPDIVGDICEASFSEEFDVIIVMEVLEHIPRPHLAIEKMFSALRRGGVLIMSTPFIFPLHDRPHDYFRYTKYGLIYLLKEFENVRIMERNGWAESLCVLQSRFLMRGEAPSPKIFTGLIVLTSIVLYPLASLLSSLWPADFITTGYLTIANKPR